MRRRGLVAVASLFVFSFFLQSAAAAPIGLFQWVFYLDGTYYDSFEVLGSSALPGNFSITPPATGAQGDLSVTVTGAGVHTFLAFYDYELNETLNTFFNEHASVNGVPPAGLAWEIDEPGYSFGDIYDHITGPGLPLDNTNAVPVGLPEDVSVAFKWSLILAAGETATIQVTTSESEPGAGFYITHFDNAGPNGTSSKLHYSTSLNIETETVPEPASAMLLLAGLGVFGAVLRRRHRL
jgi:hypothetical protein